LVPLLRDTNDGHPWGRSVCRSNSRIHPRHSQKRLKVRAPRARPARRPGAQGRPSGTFPMGTRARYYSSLTVRFLPKGRHPPPTAPSHGFQEGGDGTHNTATRLVQFLPAHPAPTLAQGEGLAHHHPDGTGAPEPPLLVDLVRPPNGHGDDGRVGVE